MCFPTEIEPMPPDLEYVIDDILEFLDNQADVSDGSDGYPQPNQAMSLAQRLREAIGEGGR